MKIILSIILAMLVFTIAVAVIIVLYMFWAWIVPDFIKEIKEERKSKK